MYNVLGSYSGTRFLISYSSCLGLRLQNGQLPSTAQAQIVPGLKHNWGWNLHLSNQLSYWIDITQAHVDKKNYLEINGSGGRKISSNQRLKVGRVSNYWATVSMKTHATTSIRGWSKKWSCLWKKKVYCKEGINKIY